MGKNIVLLLALLVIVKSGVSQNGAREIIKHQTYDTPSDTGPTFPYLEQEERGKFNKDGIYMADGTFYFEDKFKEYQVTYTIRDMGYNLKKYAVREKLSQEAPIVGAGQLGTLNTRFSGPILGLGQFVLQSPGALSGTSNELPIGHPGLNIGPYAYSPGFTETAKPVSEYGGSGTYGGSPPGVGDPIHISTIKGYFQQQPTYQHQPEVASYSASPAPAHDPNIVAAMLG